MPLIDNQICSPSLTLSESTDKFLAIRGVDKKKYFAKYLIIAGKIWEEIFQKTIWATQSTWKSLKDGKPYPYIDVPAGADRVFSVAYEDECGDIVPLYYNQQKNVVPQPLTTDCQCGCNDCDGLCEDMSSMTVTTKVAFVQFGVTYYEKTWMKLCPNGDILEYKEIPTKKYNDTIGETGDYNDDYNNDYDIGNPSFSNFEVVNVIEQRKICNLELKPCGCPVDTPDNRCKIIDHCSMYLRPQACCYKKHCREFLPEINPTHKGQIKLSECGTKIYYIKPKGGKNPKHLLVNHQTDGTRVSAETTLPKHAEMCFWAGIDYLSKLYNNVYGPGERQQALYNYNHQQNELIKFLNPLSLSAIAKVQDQENKW
jgi:hypothetical protein